MSNKKASHSIWNQSIDSMSKRACGRIRSEDIYEQWEHETYWKAYHRDGLVWSDELRHWECGWINRDTRCWKNYRTHQYKVKPIETDGIKKKCPKLRNGLSQRHRRFYWHSNTPKKAPFCIYDSVYVYGSHCPFSQRDLAEMSSTFRALNNNTNKVLAVKIYDATFDFDELMRDIIHVSTNGPKDLGYGPTHWSVWVTWSR